MEIYQLKVFLQVAKLLSFTEAADALNLTQPAVSNKIKSLETELGSSLFYRLGRKVQLTDLGLFLLEESPKLIEQEEHLLRRINEFKQGNSGLLRIGCSPAVAEGWAPRLIYEYRQRYSGIKTKLEVYRASEFLYDAITSNQIDIGFSEIEFDSFAELSARSIDRVNYKLVISPSHTLAQEEWLSIWDLLSEPWVIRSEDFASRLVFENRLSELGLSLESFPHLEVVDTLSLMRTYIKQGNYLGFVSEFELQDECQAGHILAISLQEFALSSDIFLILPKRIDQALLDQVNITQRSKSIVSPLQKLLSVLSDLPEITSSTGLERGEESTDSPKFRPPRYSPHIQTPKGTEQLTLSIGVQNSTIPTVTAGVAIKNLGLLEHFLPRSKQYTTIDYRINWCDFPLGTPIVEGLHAKKLDIGILGDYPLLTSAAQSSQMSEKLDKTMLISFVVVNPDGAGNAVVVPRDSPLQSPDDLKGQIIAVPFGSSAHGMVVRILDQLGLLQEVELCPMNDTIPRFSEKNNNIVMGYAHFSPFHEMACRQGHFRYLFKGDLGSLPSFYGVVVRRSFAEKHPDIVVCYLKALVASSHWITHVPSATMLISRWTQCDPGLINHLGRAQQASGPESGLFYPHLQIRSDWLADHLAKHIGTPVGQQFAKVDLDAWIHPQFLQEAMNP